MSSVTDTRNGQSPNTSSFSKYIQVNNTGNYFPSFSYMLRLQSNCTSNQVLITKATFFNTCIIHCATLTQTLS